MSQQAVIVAGARTAIGTSYKGSLIETDAMELATTAVGRVDPTLRYRTGAGG